MSQNSDILSQIQDAIVDGESLQQVKERILKDLPPERWSNVDVGAIENFYIDELLKLAENNFSNIFSLWIDEKKHVILFDWIKDSNKADSQEILDILELTLEHSISQDSKEYSPISKKFSPVQPNPEVINKLPSQKEEIVTSDSESDSELHELNNFFEPPKSIILQKFLQNLKECIKSNKILSTMENNLLKTAKKSFWSTFYAATNISDPELELFRLLKVILKEETLSKEFLCALDKFSEDLLEIEGPGLVVEEDVIESVSDNQDRFIGKLARFLFGKECSTFEKFKLEEQFKKILLENFSIMQDNLITEGKIKVIEFNGRVLRSGKVLEVLNEKYNPDDYDEIRIIATKKFFLDIDMIYHGKNLSIQTSKTIVETEGLVIDLSGEESDIEAEPKPDTPYDSGKVGQKGKDGIAGESSGHFVLITDEIVNQEWLNVVLNGAPGQHGQDGGNGSNGEDGEDACLTSKRSAIAKGFFWTILVVPKLMSIWNNLGEYTQTSHPGKVGCKCKGSNHILIEADYTVNVHIFEYCSGTAGEDGGKGGQGGCGGEGGEAGISRCYTSDGLEIPLKIDARKGADGKNGISGSNGKGGTDGCSSAYYNSTYDCSMWGLIRGERKRLLLEGTNTNSENAAPAKKLAKRNCDYLYVYEPSEKQGNIKTREEVQEERDESLVRQGASIATKKEQINQEALCAAFESWSKKLQTEEEQEVQKTETSEVRVTRMMCFSKKSTLGQKSRKTPPKDVNKILSNLNKKPVEIDDLNEIFAVEIEPYKMLAVNELMLSFSKSFSNTKSAVVKKILVDFGPKWILSYLRKNRARLEPVKKVDINDKETLSNDMDYRPILTTQEGVPFGMGIFELLKEDPENLDAFFNAKLTDRSKEEFRYELAQMAKISEFVNQLNLEIQGEKVSWILKKALLINYTKGYKLFKEFIENFIKSLSKEDKKLLKNELLKVLEIVSEIRRPERDDTDYTITYFIEVISDVESLLFKIDTIINVMKVCVSELATDSAQEIRKLKQVVDLESDILAYVDFIEEDIHDEFREKFKYLIEKKRCFSSTFRCLAAHLAYTNCRIYIMRDSKLELVEEYEIDEDAKLVHILLEDDEYKLLEVDRDKFELFQFRKELTNHFQVKVFQANYEYNYKFGTKCQYFNPPSIKDSSMVLCEFFPPEKSDIIQKFSLSLCFDKEYNLLLHSFYLAFKVNGCHISLEEFVFIASTVVSSHIKFQTHSNYFAEIICSCAQKDWIDEFVVVRMENMFNKRLDEKEKIIKWLSLCNDYEIKIILGEKIKTEPISEEDLLKLIESFVCAYGMGPKLKDLALEKWPEAMAHNQTFFQLRKTEMASPEAKEAMLIHAMRLADHYNAELVQKFVQKVCLRQNDTLPKNLIGILVSFFVNNELILNEENLKLLESFCTHFTAHKAARRLKSAKKGFFKLLPNEMMEEFLQVQENTEYAQILDKLGFRHKKDRSESEQLKHVAEKMGWYNPKKLEEFKVIEESCNTILEDEMPFKLIMELLFRRFEIDFDGEYKNVEEVQNRKFLEMVGKIKSNVSIVKEIAKEEDIDLNALLVIILGCVVFIKRGFNLRGTQAMAILSALRNEENILESVATGEGKSIITASIAIIESLKGKRVDIITSSSILAKREVVSPAPKGNADLFEAFGVKVGHLCTESMEERKEAYNNCDVLYSDLANLQRDYLLSEFYGSDVRRGRGFEVVIVDEVDYMLLDQGNNTLYLSHTVAGIQQLNSLLVNIWQLVCQNVKNKMENPENPDAYLPVSKLSEKILCAIEPRLTKDLLEQIFIEIDAEEAEKETQLLKNSKTPNKTIKREQKDPPSERAESLWNQLIESQTINKEGIMKKKENPPLKKLDQKVEHRLNFLLNKIRKTKPSIYVPEYFMDFAKRHLKAFVESAQNAIFTYSGGPYQVDVDRTGIDFDGHPKIIITDEGTGVDQPTSEWHEGMHQFLQLKHGCKISPLSLKAVFISNVSYLKQYRRLYGLSGTLGSDDEQQLFNDLYKVECIRVPTFKRKLFIDEGARTFTSENDWIDCIYQRTKQKLVIDNRSVLIICKSVKEATKISESLKKISQKSWNDLRPSIPEKLEEKYEFNTRIHERSRWNKIRANVHTKNANDAYRTFAIMDKHLLYTRDYVPFVYEKENRELQQCELIVATNLAGRGTDIKVSQELAKAGGLHVIVTFLPDNVRIEEQAFGRTGRCGQPGSGELISCDKFNDDSTSPDICELKILRNIREIERIKSTKIHYKTKTKVEENCFKIFSEKYQQLSQQMVNMEWKEEERRIVLNALLDQWAIWLDENCDVSEGVSKDEEKKLLEKTEIFVDKLRVSEQSLTEDSSWACLPQHLITMGLYHADAKEGFFRTLWNNIGLTENTKQETAQKYFKETIKRFPEYSSEAYYYQAYSKIHATDTSVLNSSRWKLVQSVTPDLKKAKKQFQKIHDRMYAEMAIVEHFKQQDITRVLPINAFKQQQEELVQIYASFIQSIEDILAPVVEYSTMMLESHNLATAISSYLALENAEVIVRPGLVKEEITEEILKELNVNFSRIENSKTSSKISSEDIKKLVKFRDGEDFWRILSQKGLIEEETVQYVVNKNFLNEIDVDLKKKIKQKKKDDEKDQIDKKVNQKFVKLSASEENEETVIIIEDLETLKSQLGNTLFEYMIQENHIRPEFQGKLKVQQHPDQEIFHLFGSLCLCDLKKEGMEEKEGVKILEFFMEKKLIEKENGRSLKKEKCCDHVYNATKETTKKEVNNALVKLPSCYHEVVFKVVFEKFSYALAFNQIVEEDDKNISKVPLPTNLHRQLYSKLMTNDILTSSTVDIQQLDVEQTTNDEWFGSTICNSVVDSISSDDARARKRNLKKIFDNHLKTSSKNFVDKKKLTSSDSVEQLYNTLLKNSGFDSVNALDAKLIPVDQYFATFQPSVKKNWCGLTGATYVMELTERKWSTYMLIKSAGTTLFAIVQVGVGVALVVAFPGFGAIAGKYLIQEGIGDALFVLEGMISGHLGSYTSHKVQSLLMSAIMLAGEAQHILNPAFKALSAGASPVLTVAGALGEAALNASAIYLAQKMVAEALGWLQSHLKENVEKTCNEFMQDMELKNRLDQIYVKYGKQEGNTILKKILCTYKDRTSSESEAWKTLKNIMEMCRSWLRSFLSGCQMKPIKGGSKVAKFLKYLKTATVLMTALMTTVNAAKKVSELNASMKREHKKMVETLAYYIETKKDDDNEEESNKDELKKKERESLVKNFQESIIRGYVEKILSLIDMLVLQPLATFATAKIAGWITQLATKVYEFCQEKFEEYKLQKLVKNLNDAEEAVQQGLPEAKKQREEAAVAIVKLASETNNPRIKAEAIKQDIPLDTISVLAGAEFIDKELRKELGDKYKGLEVRIVNEDTNAVYSHATSQDPDRKVVELTIKDGHYELRGLGNDTSNPEHYSCAFDALKSDPDLAEIMEKNIPTDKDFRDGISKEFMDKEKIFYSAIRSGYHQAAFQREDYGGKRKIRSIEEAIEKLSRKMLEADDPKHPESNLSQHFIRENAEDLNVQEPQKDERGSLVPNVEGDEKRPTSRSGLLTQEDVGGAAGSRISKAIREKIKEFSGDFAKCDHCNDPVFMDHVMHTISKELGGSGITLKNVSSGNAYQNVVVMYAIEYAMAEHLEREKGNKVAFRYKYYYDDAQNPNRFTNMDIELDFIKADGSRIKFRSYQQLGTLNETYASFERLRQYQPRIYTTPLRNHLRRCKGRSTSPGSTATSRKSPASRK